LPDGRIPEQLADIAMKALSLERDDRYGTVRELQAEVQAFQSSQEKGGLHFGLETWFKRRKAGESDSPS